MSVGKVSLSNGGKTATVNVTFTCALTASYSSSAQIYQTSGRLLNIGGNNAEGTCVAGDQVTVSVPVTSQLGTAFKSGPAQVIASVYQYQYNPDTYEYIEAYGETTQTARLSTR